MGSSLCVSVLSYGDEVGWREAVSEPGRS